MLNLCSCFQRVRTESHCRNLRARSSPRPSHVLFRQLLSGSWSRKIPAHRGRTQTAQRVEPCFISFFFGSQWRRSPIRTRRLRRLILGGVSIRCLSRTPRASDLHAPKLLVGIVVDPSVAHVKTPCGRFFASRFTGAARKNWNPVGVPE